MALELNLSCLYSELIEYRELVEVSFVNFSYQTYKGIEIMFPFRLH